MKEYALVLNDVGISANIENHTETSVTMFDKLDDAFEELKRCLADTINRASNLGYVYYDADLWSAKVVCKHMVYTLCIRKPDEIGAKK